MLSVPFMGLMQSLIAMPSFMPKSFLPTQAMNLVFSQIPSTVTLVEMCLKASSKGAMSYIIFVILNNKCFRITVVIGLSATPSNQYLLTELQEVHPLQKYLGLSSRHFFVSTSISLLLMECSIQKVAINTVVKHFRHFMKSVLVKKKIDKTGVINDSLGQPTVPAGSDCRLKFWDGRTDIHSVRK